MPHGLIRFGRAEWTLRDRILTLALQLYEDGLCGGGCGQPASRAHNPDMEGYYSPVKIRCEACAVREREAGEKQGQGVLIGVIDESYSEGYEPRVASPAATNRSPEC